MELFTQWKELFITQDGEKFFKVKALLKNSGISCKEKIQNMGHNNRRNGQLGSIGESPEYASIYQLYVKKADLGKAKALISNL